ncbi:MAG: sensor histidine kinase [Bacteroidota bacterium]
MDSLKQVAEEMPDDSAKVVLLIALSSLDGKNELKYASQALKLAKALDNKDLIIGTYMRKAWSYGFDAVDERIAHLDSAIQISKATNNERGVAMMRISKALVFREYGFYDKALVELQLSYDYGVATNNEAWQSSIALHQCVCYLDMKKPEEAYSHCQKALNFNLNRQDLDSLVQSQIISYAYYYLADASKQLGRTELALDYYLKSHYYAAMDDDSDIDRMNNLIDLVVLASETLTANGDTSIIAEKIKKNGFPYIEAMLDTAIALSNTDTTQDQTIRQDILECRRQWALATGNYKEAYEHLEALKELEKVSTLSEDNIDAVADLKVKSERDELEIQLLEEEIQTQKKANEVNLLWLFLGVSLLLLAISILVYQNRQKSNRLLLSAAKQEQQITSIRSMLEGQEQERARIARDLHDGLGNMLSTVKANMESLQHQVDDTETKQIYIRANEMIDEACMEVRKIAHEMMPQALEKLGLQKALEDLVWKMEANQDFEVSFDVYGEAQTLDDSTNIMLYRIVQEAFSNIIRYAEAKEVVFQMTYSDDWLNLTLEDDGKGFDMTELNKNEGIGLKSIAFRTQYIGGEYEIDSRPNMGTSMSVNVPLVNTESK